MEQSFSHLSDPALAGLAGSLVTETLYAAAQQQIVSGAAQHAAQAQVAAAAAAATIDPASLFNTVEDIRTTSVNEANLVSSSSNSGNLLLSSSSSDVNVPLDEWSPYFGNMWASLADDVDLEKSSSSSSAPTTTTTTNTLPPFSSQVVVKTEPGLEEPTRQDSAGVSVPQQHVFVKSSSSSSGLSSTTLPSSLGSGPFFNFGSVSPTHQPATVPSIGMKRSFDGSPAASPPPFLPAPPAQSSIARFMTPNRGKKQATPQRLSATNGRVSKTSSTTLSSKQSEQVALAAVKRASSTPYYHGESLDDPASGTVKGHARILKRNRLNAQASRQRKRDRMENLEVEVKELHGYNLEVRDSIQDTASQVVTADSNVTALARTARQAQTLMNMFAALKTLKENGFEPLQNPYAPAGVTLALILYHMGLWLQSLRHSNAQKAIASLSAAFPSQALSPPSSPSASVRRQGPADPPEVLPGSTMKDAFAAQSAAHKSSSSSSPPTSISTLSGSAASQANHAIDTLETVIRKLQISKTSSNPAQRGTTYVYGAAAMAQAESGSRTLDRRPNVQAGHVMTVLLPASSISGDGLEHLPDDALVQVQCRITSVSTHGPRSTGV